MKDFLEYLLKLIIDNPSEIKVEENSLGENFFQYIITTNKDDIGKVIGKEGKIIQAIRNVAKVLAVKENKQVRIEVG